MMVGENGYYRQIDKIIIDIIIDIIDKISE